MANNRLYIEDTETGERLLFAKSWGDRWRIALTAEQLDAWLATASDEFPARDWPAAGSSGDAPSRLRFRTEGE